MQLFKNLFKTNNGEACAALNALLFFYVFIIQRMSISEFDNTPMITLSRKIAAIFPQYVVLPKILLTVSNFKTF